ncbi:uncharacterized protein OCT59_000452 [Rhizophagus irregularis]|uniref:uncharacterized protein n=1 Tax=Rhizophagus irregularis TaxID=588596 RepID=UPI0033267AD5|nr:hypothetical protein OCT59_000452 [Rhizophagus irregularis]
MEPNRTLSTGPVVGKKLSKEWVTIALCCNASGTEKAQYRKLFLRNRIKAFDNSQENGQPIPEITIKKAIKYAAKAWELVQPVTITNGWRKTGILPPSTDNDIDFDFDEFEEVDQLQDLIGQLASKIYRSPISAEEYLEYEKDETNHQMMTDKEIIKMITEPEEPNDVEGPEIPIISNYKALAALNQIITYMEQKSDKMEFSNDHIRTIKKLHKGFCSPDPGRKNLKVNLQKSLYFCSGLPFGELGRTSKVQNAKGKGSRKLVPDFHIKGKGSRKTSNFFFWILSEVSVLQRFPKQKWFSARLDFNIGFISPVSVWTEFQRSRTPKILWTLFQRFCRPMAFQTRISKVQNTEV